jgi:hypothetical protein
VALLVFAVAARAAEPPPLGDLTTRLPSGSTAIEYWDVTAWFESGHRLFVRFLVTNDGPGVETAAAVGHVILPEGEVVVFKWGREQGRWTFGEDGRLKIGKAVLVLGGPTVVVEVDSNKRGIKLGLEIARAGPPVATSALPGEYWVDVVMPAPAQARLWVRGMTEPRAVAGTGALTHTWMEQREGDLIRRRSDLFARVGDTSIYVSELARVAGPGRTTLVASEGGRILDRADDAALVFGPLATSPEDARYPVPARWQVRSAALEARVGVSHELLRWNPLEVLPQPFRFLLALRGQPQRVWADADVDLTRAPRDGGIAVRGGGIVALTFTQPTPLP